MPQRVVSNQKNKKKTKWSNWWLNRTRLLLLLCILTISVSLRYACLLNFPANDWAAPIIISTLVVVVVVVVFAPQPHLGSCRNWLEFTASGYKFFFEPVTRQHLYLFVAFTLLLLLLTLDLSTKIRVVINIYIVFTLVSGNTLKFSICLADKFEKGLNTSIFI